MTTITITPGDVTLAGWKAIYEGAEPRLDPECIPRVEKSADAVARIVFEVQNWRSDVASQTAGGDSVNFIGLGVHTGMIF